MKEPLNILDILGQIRANKIVEVDLGLKLDRISASQVNRLFEFLKKTQSVKTLDLGCNKLQKSEDRLKQLCSVIENNNSITAIELYGNSFTVNQLELLAKALVKNTTITALTYEIDDMDDDQSEAIEIIRLCLERNQNIATLNRCTSNDSSESKDLEQTSIKQNGYLLFKPATSNPSKNVFHVWREEKPIDIEALKKRNQYIENALERGYLPDLEESIAQHFARQ